MAVRYIDVDVTAQTAALSGLVAEDDPFWRVVDLVDQLDLGMFEGAYRADGSGGRPYDPRLLLIVVLHCYRLGIRSPVGIARAVRERVDVRALFGTRLPSASTVRRFVTRHRRAVSDLFVQVLARCGDEGLVDAAVTATDGTPVRAAAALTANRGAARLTLRIAQTRQRLDALTRHRQAAAEALDHDTDLDDYIEVVCRSIPDRIAVLQRQLTRLRRAEAIAHTRAEARAAVPHTGHEERIRRARHRIDRHERTLTAMITDQEARIADYRRRAALAAHRGRNPDGRVPIPVARSVHINRQRQALTNARQHLTELQSTHPV
ncbi:transposase [Dactylosporangium sp. NPDC000555]|uniref:transposase n=1 Tax=Dactylosporangium sp. NPDC000555 TaxID=3154260 RepID=UPI0033349B48